MTSPASPQERLPRGMLLIGHGTRDNQGKAQLLETSRLVARRLADVPVQPCFLELAEPNLQQAFSRLLVDGVRQVVAVPLLLFAAGHWKQDIPRELDRVASNHPDVPVRLARHLGNHAALLELSVLRFTEAVAAVGHAIDPSDTALILVGRGSSDATASEELFEFARQRALLAPVAQNTTCFLAKARPTVPEAFESMSASGLRVVVVQPHLIFDGELLNGLQAMVGDMNQREATQEWMVTEPLGPSELLVSAIVDRFREAF